MNVFYQRNRYRKLLFWYDSNVDKIFTYSERLQIIGACRENPIALPDDLHAKVRSYIRQLTQYYPLPEI